MYLDHAIVTTNNKLVGRSLLLVATDVPIDQEIAKLIARRRVSEKLRSQFAFERFHGTTMP